MALPGDGRDEPVVPPADMTVVSCAPSTGALTTGNDPVAAARVRSCSGAASLRRLAATSAAVKPDRVGFTGAAAGRAPNGCTSPC